MWGPSPPGINRHNLIRIAYNRATVLYITFYIQVNTDNTSFTSFFAVTGHAFFSHTPLILLNIFVYFCRPVISEIFYLLADFYFKNKEFRYLSYRWCICQFTEATRGLKVCRLNNIFPILNYSLLSLVDFTFQKIWKLLEIYAASQKIYLREFKKPQNKSLMSLQPV